MEGEDRRTRRNGCISSARSSLVSDAVCLGRRRHHVGREERKYPSDAHSIRSSSVMPLPSTIDTPGQSVRASTRLCVIGGHWCQYIREIVYTWSLKSGWRRSVAAESGSGVKEAVSSVLGTIFASRVAASEERRATTTPESGHLYDFGWHQPPPGKTWHEAASVLISQAP